MASLVNSTGSRLMVGSGNGGICSNDYKILVIIWINSGDIMYSMVTIVNNIVLYTRKLRWMYVLKVIGLPCGAVVKNPPANAGDTGSTSGLRRSHMLQSN